MCNLQYVVLSMMASKILSCEFIKITEYLDMENSVTV